MFLFCSPVNNGTLAGGKRWGGRAGGRGDGLMTDDDGAQPDRGGTVGFCRQRAVECLEAAEAAPDPQVREDWIMLANLWTHMALRAAREIAASRPAKRDSA
jgi:hypothetical protein